MFKAIAVAVALAASTAVAGAQGTSTYKSAVKLTFARRGQVFQAITDSAALAELSPDERLTLGRW